MHVITNGLKIASAAGIDRQGFVAPAKEVSKEPVPVIKAHGVSAQEPFHAGHQVGAGGSMTGCRWLLMRHQAWTCQSVFSEASPSVFRNSSRSLFERKIGSRWSPRFMTW